MGKYHYIYISTSFWDSQVKQSRNIKVNIGKLDINTGEPIFKNDVIESLKATNSDIDQIIASKFPVYSTMINLTNTNNTANSISFYPGDTIKFGIIYFIYYIAKYIGLLDIITTIFPNVWKQIITIATFLIVENRPLMYCDNFMDERLCFNIGIINSQRSSELLRSISEKDCIKFYKEWYKLISEKEYIALDTTSISSYSENIPEVQWGRNKETKSLKQINICLLFGETSGLPVFQSIYSGSMVDVATLCSTINEFESIVGPSNIIVVMDKGFFSDKNLRALLKKKTIKFLLAVPFTNNKAKLLVEEFKDSKFLDDISNLITTRTHTMMGAHKSIVWHDQIKLHTHVFFNSWTKQKEHNALFEYLFEIKKAYLSNLLKQSEQKELNKYFIINNNYHKANKKHIIQNDEVINNELKHSGWLVLLSNFIKSPQKAINIYRNKDTVEKAFEAYKYNLGIKRFHVKSYKCISSKSFIAFIALILKSHIEKVMDNANIFKKYTFDKLILNIDSLRCFFNSDNEVFIKELQASQKEILDHFSLNHPTSDILSQFIKLL
jgi:transposase